MTNLLAYLIAIAIVYRKHLLTFLALILVAGYFMYAPSEITQKQMSDETARTDLLRGLERRQPVAVNSDQLGRRFASLEELKSAEKSNGYLPTGYFGDKWPARVTEVKTGQDSIEFVQQNGTKHRYQGFDGYQMKVVRLVTAANEETLIVFCSEKKY